MNIKWPFWQNLFKLLVDRGDGGDSERGVGPGTYYYVVTNTGNLTATVVFSGFWEERI